MKRRISLRMVEKSGKGRYSGQYAFSGKIECGCCGAGFRRHNHHGKKLWVCKQHIKSAAICEALPIKEEQLEEAFVTVLNEAIQNRHKVIQVVTSAVNEAVLEAGEDRENASELLKVDGEIQALQAQILELNKQRARREIQTDTYTSESREVMEKLDTLFAERDKFAQLQSSETLSQALHNVVCDFLTKTGEKAVFDRDIFTKLIDSILVKSREDISFIFKDGSIFKAELAKKGSILE